MYVYKFKDNVDGNYCFIAHETVDEAAAILLDMTTLSFSLVSKKSAGELPEKWTNRVKGAYPIPKGHILFNSIVPF